MSKKNFKLKAEEIRQLIKPMGGCIASDKITVNGELVNFMYRDKPEFTFDSGWRFLSGTENQKFADDSDKWSIYDVNTIANYDPAIIQYIDLPIGTDLERINGTNKFKIVK